MSQTISPSEFHVPLKIYIRSIQLTEEQFFLLCQENEELRFERSAQGEVLIWPLVGGTTSIRNGRLSAALGEWTKIDGTGMAFASCTGFTLPNGAVRSPDASWLTREKWKRLTKDQRERFAPVCPDFIAELYSEVDRPSDLQNKMHEYVDNGARLGWLFDPLETRVYIYRPGQSVEMLENPKTVSGDPVLPGFVLQVQELW